MTAESAVEKGEGRSQFLVVEENVMKGYFWYICMSLKARLNSTFTRPFFSQCCSSTLYFRETSFLIDSYILAGDMLECHDTWHRDRLSLSHQTGPVHCESWERETMRCKCCDQLIVSSKSFSSQHYRLQHSTSSDIWILNCKLELLTNITHNCS